MTLHTRISELFHIRYPIIQGGMAWVSRAELVSAVSNAGGLGLLGSSTMRPDELREEIKKVRTLTSHPFGVNVAIMTGDAEAKIAVCIEEKVPVVVTAAGSPKLFTDRLKKVGCVVAHVVPTQALAVKSAQAGVDAIICEGTEAGGHDGPAEITTLTLVPLVKAQVSIPVIAAGGITTGAQMAAAMVLGAEGVQLGTRFVASVECNAHSRFKEAIVDAGEDGTLFVARQYVPQRLVRNPFAEHVRQLELNGATREEIEAAYGHKRGYRGSVEGDWAEGYFNCGQGAALIDSIKTVADIIHDLVDEYEQARRLLCEK